MSGSGVCVKTGTEKLKDVTRLLAELEADIESSQLDENNRKLYLEQLKIYGRDPTNANPIYTAKGIQIIASQAFSKHTSILASREALSCIANSLLLQVQTREYLADLEIWSKLVERLKSGNTHDEFLVSRILLVETYCKNSSGYEAMIKDHQLCQTINKKIATHAARYAKRSKLAPVQAMDENALIETCKLIFNITALWSDFTPLFTPSISNLFSIFNEVSLPASLKQPIASVLNSLLNLDHQAIEWTNTKFIDSQNNGIIPRLVAILDTVMKKHQDAELETLAAPVVTLISKILGSNTSNVSAYLQKSLLPSDEDRKQVLGRSQSLPSRMLQLSNSPSAPQLGGTIKHLLFQLSDSDSDTFVRNVGFGFASGALVEMGLPLPQGAHSATTDTSGAQVNPITGQRLDREVPVDLPPMTEEEKEQEAERLFVLFERLRRTGVVDVVNPAANAGRIEEIPD